MVPIVYSRQDSRGNGHSQRNGIVQHGFTVVAFSWGLRVGSLVEQTESEETVHNLGDPWVRPGMESTSSPGTEGLV